MAAYIISVITAVVFTSALFFPVARCLMLCRRSLIIKIAMLNIIFCIVFPLLFALLSGRTADGAPSMRFAAVISILALWTVIYIALLVWGVVLKSNGLRLNTPVPAPDSQTGTNGFTGGYQDAYKPDGNPPNNAEKLGFIKNSVDSAQNLDKMSISMESFQDMRNMDLDSIINQAFDFLGGGMLEKAAEYFYCAMEKNPPKYLEYQIALQLSMIYNELGRKDLSSDILAVYGDQYQG